MLRMRQRVDLVGCRDRAWRTIKWVDIEMTEDKRFGGFQLEW